ncbi:MAG TPA: hypothetical protein VIK97_17615, partial [Casimicrobiaceae bacterium]
PAGGVPAPLRHDRTITPPNARGMAIGGPAKGRGERGGGRGEWAPIGVARWFGRRSSLPAPISGVPRYSVVDVRPGVAGRGEKSPD